MIFFFLYLEVDIVMSQVGYRKLLRHIYLQTKLTSSPTFYQKHRIISSDTSERLSICSYSRSFTISIVILSYNFVNTLRQKPSRRCGHFIPFTLNKRGSQSGREYQTVQIQIGQLQTIGGITSYRESSYSVRNEKVIKKKDLTSRSVPRPSEFKQQYLLKTHVFFPEIVVVFFSVTGLSIKRS